jgi:hypothetical protein
MMSRNSLYVAVFSTLLVGILCLAGGCTTQQAASTTTQQAVSTSEQEATTTALPTTTLPPLALSADGWLMGVALPTTVSQVVDKLGEPSAVQLPDLEKDPSPWGQWFRWEVAGGDNTFSVLNEAYSDKTPDYKADVKVSVLRRDGDVVSPVVIDGVSLGKTTRSDVETIFGDKVKSSNLATRWQFDETGVYASCLVRKQGGIYTFYLFDQDDVLAGLAQATYDLGNVD